MDALPMFFESLKKNGLSKGHFLGFIHILIGRRIAQADGMLVSAGLGWREVAGWLRKIRWDPEDVRELGQEPGELPPRDRQRFWFTAIAQAEVGSAAASKAGDRFAEVLRKHGYEVGPPPKSADPATTANGKNTDEEKKR
jgi:hypothetical protein